MSFFDAIVKRAVDAVSPHFDEMTRIRPIETIVDGDVVEDISSLVTDIRGLIIAVDGNERETGWAQVPEGRLEMTAEYGADIIVGDLIDPETGRWVGKRFRVTERDALTPYYVVELVNAANEGSEA